MSNKSYFVISLDFELYWGMFDKVTQSDYGKNIRGVHTVIPELLALFVENDIHATWATVGMLMHPNKQSLLQALPEEDLRPSYPDTSMSSYTYLKSADIGTDESIDLHHFGHSLVQKITQTRGQELASHTFSHYYCIDGSENSEAIFTADCTAMQTSADQFQTKLTSIVFPRNQTNPKTLSVCAEHGLTAYRGTENHFLYKPRKESAQTNPLIRIIRLLDHYINISGNHTYSLKHENSISGLLNIPASRFLRPYSHTLRHFEKLRMRRIKNAMTHAAKNNEVFHLWWHPHNFGINQKENLQNLLEIIKHYHTLNEKYGMQSMNMHKLAKITSSLR